MSQPTVLIVDDEIRSLQSLKRVLGEEFQVITATNADEAWQLLETEWVHAILCDQRMPEGSGVDFLKKVRARWPDPVRMIISGFTDSEDIIAGINEAGIYQYITKPWSPDDLLKTVQGAVELFDLQRENQNASVEMRLATSALEKVVARKKSVLKHHYGFDRIIHAPTSPLKEVIGLAEKISQYDISVLITGESGTGKELLARAIHYNSHRAGKPFVVENCGAMPDQLLESELFGYKKGSFTGAYEDRIGLFEQASGGTIFLDEIGETSPAFQVKLLRVLQEGEIRPLGSRFTRKIDIRIIAATNRDLEDELAAKRFRNDLYYRLAGFRMHIPTLKERPMDINPLADMILKDAARSFNKQATGFAPGVAKAMNEYLWPGNVRELQNEIQRMVALCDDEIIGDNFLPDKIRFKLGHRTDSLPKTGNLKQRLDIIEERVINETIARHGWNISRAAMELGLSRVGLRGKLKRYGFERD